MRLRYAATLEGRVGAVTEVQAGACYWEGELTGVALSAFLRLCMDRDLLLEAAAGSWRVRARRCWYDADTHRLQVQLTLAPVAEI